VKRILLMPLVLTLGFAICVTAFASGSPERGKAAARGGKMKIGLSFSDFVTERWPMEAALLTELGYDKGVQVISQVANHDEKLQNDQIANMVLLGVNALIIIAEDGDAAAAAAAAAHDAGVKVIAYDRLIRTPKLDAYISFDNVEVGRAQARGVLAARDSGNFVLLGGSPMDNNAILLRNGQMEVLKPLIDKGQVKVVADQWVENWEPANATRIMENILTAVNNKVDAVVASNDGTAMGALQALQARGLAGKVPISGQDATTAGSKSIVEGGLTMTVFKDFRALSPLAIDLAIDLVNRVTSGPVGRLKMYDLAALALNKRLTGQVPCYFLPVVQVDKENLYDVVVKSGFQKYDDVYGDIPEGKRPSRP
jgi:D-xylose transport system substrate-binding protein